MATQVPREGRGPHYPGPSMAAGARPPKDYPGTQLRCMTCTRKGFDPPGHLGVLYWNAIVDGAAASHGRWMLAVRQRVRPIENRGPGETPRVVTDGKRRTLLGPEPQGAADVRCNRCGRPVTLSAKTLGRRADAEGYPRFGANREMFV